MTPADFKEQIRLLTGRPVAVLTPEENAAIDSFLEVALRDEKRSIDYSQFNELLLIVNKDRVSEFFFQFFFGPRCTVSKISKGIEKFQKIAMLCFGNFIYGYRTLSKVENAEDLERHLGDYCRTAHTLWAKFEDRTEKILNVTEIPKARTPLLGYISSGKIREEHRIAKGLAEFFPNSDSWEDLLYALTAMRERVKDREKEVAVVDATVRLVENFRSNSSSGGSLADFGRRLSAEKPRIDAQHQVLKETEVLGNTNTDIYLSWDHMDVYFATSMRNRWEFEDVSKFVGDLMSQPIQKLPPRLQPLRKKLLGKTLDELKIRYFDPTQSYDRNRINKGLVEALMLKRAACTVYSVQDTDTLGKDSELAATLAQGKPVIAYAPTIKNIKERAKQLSLERPGDLKYRLQFILFADERELKPEDTAVLLSFLPRLEEFERQMLWKSIGDETAAKRFRKQYANELRSFCEVIARSEERIYTKREKTLRQDHPLAIQVNLESGVANGVLVVRDISICADLLLRTLTGTLEFDIKYNPETDCWELIETLSQCVYRVVTND
jgi:hypothetical protein